MMRFIHVAVAALSLLSVSQSAPVTNCDSLIQPFEINGREQLLGKWVHVVESSNTRGVKELMKKFQDSFWLKITAANESDAINAMVSSKMFGLCVTATVKMTLENNTLRLYEPETGNKGREEILAEAAGTTEPVKILKLMKTGCPDCLLLHPPDNVMEMTSTTVRGLLLLSKRSTVTAAELDEFREQSECLNLQHSFSLNPEGDVCPEPPSQDTEDTDVLRLFVNGQETDFANLVDNITNSVGGAENFSKIIRQAYLKDK